MKQLARKIDRIAGKKQANHVARMKEPYRELLQNAAAITQRARELCVTLTQPNATSHEVFEPVRPRHVFPASPPRVAEDRWRFDAIPRAPNTLCGVQLPA